MTTQSTAPTLPEVEFMQELQYEQSCTDQIAALPVGESIYRAALVNITADWQRAVTDVKMRFVRTFRSAKFRAQERDSTLDFDVDTSSTPHGDGSIIVVATIRRTA